VLGLVSSKLARLEGKDELKRRIDEAARHAALGDLALSPQCGFSSTVHGNKVTEDDEVRKLGLVVEVAAEGITLHPASIAALIGQRAGAQMLPWVLCVLLAGLLLVVLLI